MAAKKRSTLTDVARRAGVSVTTASYILNGRSAQMRISPDTDTRVKQAIEELDYHPNWSARALRRESTQTVGFVSDRIAGGAFAAELLAGANAEARRHGSLLVAGDTEGDPAAIEPLVEQLHRRQVDSVVLATLSASRVVVPERLRGGRAVLLNCEDPDAGLPSVLPDDEGAGRLAADLVLARRPGTAVHVVGEDPTREATAGVARLRGLVGRLEEAGAGLAGVVPCPWEVVPARETVLAWMASGGRPETLVCLNDRVAFGVYQALALVDLRVPDDVAVLSFDGSELSGWLLPTLTSLRLPLEAMGRRAVELLMAETWEPRSVERLPMLLMEGGSLPDRS